MKKTALYLAFMLFSVIAVAQDPARVLNRHRDSIPAEQLYMHFDKQAYTAGETIWFKGYVKTAGTEGFISTNFFADLLDEKGEVLQSKKFPVMVEGSINGQFDIPATAPQGIYIIRAWTNYTRFFDHSFMFKKAVPVFNPATAAALPADEKGYVFEWYPENGKLLNGVSNVLAYRCVDKKMQPVVISGNLLSAKGEDLGSFSTNKYGLGYFSFPPVKGEKYFAEILFPDKSQQKIELPQAVDNGLVLNVVDHEEGKIFTLLTSPNDATAPTEVTLIAAMNNATVLKANVPLKDNEAQGLVATANLTEGILKIYAFDKSGNLLAQRASYVSLENFHVPVIFKTIKQSTEAKGYNEMSFVLPAGTQGNFSIAVTDAGKELVSANDENIFTSMLAAPGKKQPGTMQVKDEEVRDLIMLTSSWVFDDWNVYAKMKSPKIADDLHLPFKGRLYESSNNKLISGGNLDILVRTKDSTDFPYTVPVMEDGSFKLYELTFEDTARIYYGWAGSKNERLVNTSIEFDRDLDFAAWLKNHNVQQWLAAKRNLLNTPGSSALAAQLIADSKTTQSFASRILQKEQKREEQKPAGGTKDVNKRYATGAFSSMTSAKILDLINEPPPSNQGNIFNYIVGKMSGFTIENVAGRYGIYSNRSTSTREALSGNNRGLVAGKVYLDEQETTMDMISRIPLDQIAMVKYFAPGTIMIPGIGLSCVLAVYTRKPEDLNNSKKRYTNSIVFAGYPSGKTFSAPDYTTDDVKQKDNRSTLYWNPNVTVSSTGSNEIRIRFYNNDTGKRFHVVMEGVTNDGRMLSFDKIVE